MGCVNGIQVNVLPIESITGFCSAKEIQKQGGAHSVIGIGPLERNTPKTLQTGGCKLKVDGELVTMLMGPMKPIFISFVNFWGVY